jgi:hypothetical protein
MKKNLFEEYMQMIHANKFPEVLDDDLPDHFEAWIGNLDGAEIMERTEDFTKELLSKLGEKVRKYTLPKIEYDGWTWDMIINTIYFN